MRNYTGKTVFVGIDVHKKTYAITCICDNEIVKRDTITASPRHLLNYLNKYFVGAKIKTAYEAGFSGFVLHRFLLEFGIENIVVHPASIEISARDRVKTDKRDSLKIAKQLSDGRLKGIYVPGRQREAYREVSRTREKIVRDKKRVGNRLKSLLYRQGLLGADDEDAISKKWLKKVADFECDASIKYSIQICIDEWLFLRKKQKEIDEELARQASADKELEEIYRSIPGIGIVHARVLSNELEGMRHFSNEKQLFSYTGLTPSEHSSGKHKRLGHISRQGRSVLRKTLIQAAWRAINKDTSLKNIYERIANRSGKKRAIVGVARRLIGQARSCFKSNSLYCFREVEIIEFCRETGEISLAANS